MKKFISKIEETLSCFFHTPIKLKEWKFKSGEVGPEEEAKRIWFKNKPTSIVVTLKDLQFLSVSDKQEYDTFMIDLLTSLKGYK